MQELQKDDPQRLGPYRLVGRLGSGGMGLVFLGRSAGGRLVAVKVIRDILAADPEFRARFGREVAAARRVSGLFTALVVDADTDSPTPWLATAYVAGPSLDDAVSTSGPLPPASVLSLAAALAEALGAIHAAGLVHRDLKPSNVLLAEDGPRVIDFGISRAAEASALTRPGSVPGTPGFMSPEQVEGKEVGPASDVFSLGSVLVFAATGVPPFGTGPTADYRVVHGSPRLDDVPSQVRPIAERCLAKDPGQRPTPAELLAELGDVDLGATWLPTRVPKGSAQHATAAQESTIAPEPMTPAETQRTADDRLTEPDESPPPLPPPRRSRKGRLWAAGAILAAVAVTVVTVILLTSSPSPPPIVQQSPLATVSRQSPTSTVSRVATNLLKPGDCLIGSDLSLNTNAPFPISVEVVPCGQPHIAEVFYASPNYWPAHEAYPGDTATYNQVDAECIKAFKTYVGIPVSSSIFSYTSLYPDSGGWAEGDRSSQCVAWEQTGQYPGGAPLYGSVRGSRK